MREAVYISYGSHMRAGPLGPENALKKLRCTLGKFSNKENILGSPWGDGSMMPQWGHELSKTPPAESDWKNKKNVGTAADLWKPFWL